MSKLKVLVVDDASFVRDLVKRTVRTQFPAMELHEAENGRKAQILLGKAPFDLVLCDWEMPEMSGLELLRWMRQHDHFKKTPFVMITSRGDKSHVVEAIKEGVSEYLGKPFSAEMLTQKILKVLGKQARSAMVETTGVPLTDALRASASLLTQARVAPAEPKSAPTMNSALLGGAPATTPAKTLAVSSNAKQASVRFAGTALTCIVKAIGLTEVKVVAKREEKFPGILEQAVVDIELEEGNMARLNGYVHQLQAVDKRMDTDFVSIIIRFVDEDPLKLEQLSKFIARM